MPYRYILMSSNLSTLEQEKVFTFLHLPVNTGLQKNAFHFFLPFVLYL